MYILLLALVALGLFAALLALISHHRGEKDEVVIPPPSSCATCDGVNAKCEQECVMEAATQPIEYFDDEELDTFKGRPSDQYTDEEADQFAEVMYTMKPEEVKDWNRSLILRGINVPDQIKDELITLING
ncbi:MAG: hypothetical protein PUD15_09295 [Prevotella sp.]|uniref:hypothetical protein n=1 Tax=Prevotella sp. AGR2160 TaxID=1280674 RepID=UPI0004066941|nr:hypothetical protein [Prevotella sp. AGR2160]MDD5862728.1 hypothetical protein [Prevotella sp.]